LYAVERREGDMERSIEVRRQEGRVDGVDTGCRCGGDNGVVWDHDPAAETGEGAERVVGDRHARMEPN
jgi:hypothetical protein